ncbi:MAG: acetolactate decarboxylase [Solirubrobacteraceae bacterium]|nr:acetolactate decarboxylase [Solirubrobacteraceae bacterium]
MAPLDPALVRALHPGVTRRRHLRSAGAPHEVFQTSTLAALLDGAYEGDVTFGELRQHGDLGLGTLQRLDGEMIALDGEFWQASADGSVRPIADGERTPFAVVCPFTPDLTTELPTKGHDDLLSAIERYIDVGTGTAAFRIDGRFSTVVARSVPRQQRPYPPLAAVADQQVVFEWHDLDATVVGFRFPDVAAGIELPGYHLHIISADRTRGGHVLRADLVYGDMQVDRLSTLRLELPPGVQLPGAPDEERAEVLSGIERGPKAA